MSLFNKPLDLITLADLEELIGQYESDRLEVKIHFPDSDRSANDDNKKRSRIQIVEQIVAFANNAGGHLIFGIREERIESRAKIEEVVGIDMDNLWLAGNWDDLYKDLSAAVNLLVSPAIYGVKIKNVKVTDSKLCVVIRVPKSRSKPHGMRLAYDSNKAFRFSHRSGSQIAHWTVDEVKREMIANFSYLERMEKFIKGCHAVIQSDDFRNRKRRHSINNEGEDVFASLHISTVIVDHGLIGENEFESIQLGQFAQVATTGNETGVRIANYPGYQVHERDGICQYYRDGSIHYYRSLFRSLGTDDSYSIEQIERSIIEMVLHCLHSQQIMQTAGPYTISVFVIGLDRDLSYRDRAVSVIRKVQFVESPPSKCMLIPIQVDEIPHQQDGTLTIKQIAETIRPTLDHLWNAVELPYSYSFDEDGNYRST